MSAPAATTSPTRPSDGLPAIPTSTAVLLAVLILATLGFILGLVLIVGPEGREDTQQWITGLFSLIGTILSGTALAQVQRVARGQVATHESVTTVQHQTNGRLDQLMAATTEKIVAQVVAQLTPEPDGVAKRFQDS